MKDDEESEMSDGELDEFLKYIHPASVEQDDRCPHIFWEGYDLVHCPGVGEWKCGLQPYMVLGEYGGPGTLEHKACDKSYRDYCSLYFNWLKGEEIKNEGS